MILTHRARSASARILALTGLLALVTASPGCFNSDQPGAASQSAGGAAVLKLVKLEWGRLVNIADLNGTLVEMDVLVRQDVQPDGINYDLSINPVTEEETLTILQVSGSGAFNTLLAAAEAGLPVIETKGPSAAPPFPLVPRNAAIRLCFSEQVNPASVDSTTVRLKIGDPPSLEQTVRLLVQNDPASGLGYIVVDPTISARQSASLGLPQNPSGFPASFNSTADNLLIELPTKVNTTFGQAQVLRNLANTRGITFGPADPLGTDLGGNPVVLRSLRSGNGADLFNGFLLDVVRPNLVTRKDVTISQITFDAINGTHDIYYSLDQVFCQNLSPKSGDVMEVGAAVFVGSAVIAAPVGGPFQVRGRLLEGSLTTGAGLSTPGRLTTRYLPQDAALQTCFLEFTPFVEPTPGNPIILDAAATVKVRFDEAIDALSVLSMHSFVLAAHEPTIAPDNTRPFDPITETVAEFIDRQRGFHNPWPAGNNEFGGRILFGPVEVGTGSRTFTLAPLAGLAIPDPTDPNPQEDPLALRDGQDGITDLSGNAVDFTSFVAGTPGAAPEQGFQVDDPGGAAPRDKYFALRGMGIDEDDDGLPEYGGQFDTQTGKITGRPPQRFARQADPSQISVSSGLPSGGPTSAQPSPFEPLTPAGAVVMGIYRPHDLGFVYTNVQEYNLDVEGMAWSPLGGVVNDDIYPQFSLAFSHANTIADEVPNIAGLPVFPLSGLLTGQPFDDNILGFPTYDEQVLMDTSYTLRAINLFQAGSGTTMLPYPNFFGTYTWRDTTIPASFTGGSAQSAGSPPSLFGAPVWGPEMVPSVGLPLLWRARCYPRGNFIGTNQFQVSNMIPTAIGATTSPAFRVFSSGGEDAGGNFKPVAPDNAAQGGTQPIGGFLNGQQTPNHDQTVYWAQVDFVVRVSRVYTHWFDMGKPLAVSTDIVGTLLEPANISQNQGTEVILEYRGSPSVQDPANPNNTASPLRTAESIFDAFGDFTGSGGSVSSPGIWSTVPTIALINPSQPYKYFQLRFTFVSNADSAQSSFLDGFGFAWDF